MNLVGEIGIKTGESPRTYGFDDLCAQFLASVQQASHGYWENRDVDATPHEDFLAISWRGSLEYWIAREYWKVRERKRRKAREKGFNPDSRRGWLGNGPVLIDEGAEKEARGTYGNCRERPHTCEAIVFYKTANIAPASLIEMAPGVQQAFADAPLHTFFVIGREQRPRPSGEALEFSSFRPLSLGGPHRQPDKLVRALLDIIFPKKADRVEAEGDGGCKLCIVAGCLALVLVLGLSAAFAVPQSRSRLLDWLGIAEQAAVEAMDLRLTDLEQQYRVLREQRDIVSITRPEPGEGLDARLAGIEAELDRLGGLIEARGGQTDGAARTSLDMPACLPVENRGGRMVPAYLFRAELSDAGIRVLSTEPVYSMPETVRSTGDVPALGLSLPAGPMSPAAFEAAMRPVSDVSRAAGCRHFVLLAEDEPGAADRYIAQRAAVERHFYLYRLQS